MLKQHKKLIMYLFKPFTGRFVLLSALLMLIAVLDAAIPYATKIAIDRFITPMTTEGLVPFATLYAGIILVFGTLIVIFIILAGKLESGIAYRLRKESFDRMQDYNFSYFDEEGVGKVLSKITSDIGKLSDIISWGACGSGMVNNIYGDYFRRHVCHQLAACGYSIYCRAYFGSSELFFSKENFLYAKRCEKAQFRNY